MSQTEVQLIKADAVQTGDIANSAVTDAKIAGLTSSKLTGALPAISGAALTNLPASGITMADQWRRTTNIALSNNLNLMTTDWERVDSSGQGTLTGSGGMTESGGIFTFPSTGIYFLRFQGYFEDTGSSATVSTQIHITTDNNTYSRRAININHISNIGSYTYGYCACETLVDVTSTSDVKVKFGVSSEGSTAFDSSSTENRNCATFIRLGDT
tara:strand:- start:45 stop:683 length:639 start_codon:yes stop_codon:yes gene_type:complete